MGEDMAMHDGTAVIDLRSVRVQVETNLAVGGDDIVILTTFILFTVGEHLHVIDVQVEWMLGCTLYRPFLHAVRIHREGRHVGVKL